MIYKICHSCYTAYSNNIATIPTIIYTIYNIHTIHLSKGMLVLAAAVIITAGAVIVVFCRYDRQLKRATALTVCAMLLLCCCPLHIVHPIKGFQIYNFFSTC